MESLIVWPSKRVRSFKRFRKNVIVLITPALEVDGADRMVDTYNYRKANPAKAVPPLVYWGHYVCHDNNRDGLAWRWRCPAIR